MNLKRLAEPFPERDVEWRIGQVGKNGKGPWAKVLAYISNRAVQQRLDDVCGPENWQNEYKPGPSGGVVCGLSIRCNGEWVTKWDGAENTDIESIKGGLSDSMKRAAVQWGIGRYLYDLEEGWADINENGSHYTKDFRWDPPRLPSWALPGANGKQELATKQEQRADPQKPESEQHKAFAFAISAKVKGTKITSERIDEIFLAALEHLPDVDGGIHDLTSIKWCTNQHIFDGLLAALSKELTKTVEHSPEYLKFKSFVEGMVATACNAGLEIWPDGVNSVLGWLLQMKVFASKADLVACKDIRKFAAAQKKIEEHQRKFMPQEVQV